MLLNGLQDKTKGGMIHQIMHGGLVFPRLELIRTTFSRGLEQFDVDPAVNGAN